MEKRSAHPQVIKEREDWIKSVYLLIGEWYKSDYSICAFCKIIGVSESTFYRWRDKFTPGSLLADEYWMKVGGIFEHQKQNKRNNVKLLQQKWLDFCQRLEEKIDK